MWAEREPKLVPLGREWPIHGFFGYVASIYQNKWMHPARSLLEHGSMWGGAPGRPVANTFGGSLVRAMVRTATSTEIAPMIEELRSFSRFSFVLRKVWQMVFHP